MFHVEHLKASKSFISMLLLLRYKAEIDLGKTLLFNIPASSFYLWIQFHKTKFPKRGSMFHVKHSRRLIGRRIQEQSAFRYRLHDY